MTCNTMVISFVGIVLLLFLAIPAWSFESQCSVDDVSDRDPNLRKMDFTYDLGQGDQEFWAYVTPPVSSFYVNEGAPSERAVEMKHEGLGAKFINLSNQQVYVYWESQLMDFDLDKGILTRILPPLSAKGTSTYTKNSFVFALEDNTFLKRVIIDPEQSNLHSYDPFLVEGDEEATIAAVHQHLSEEEQKLYWKWRNTLTFDVQYRAFTGRSYYATFPRQPPMHFMWPAQHFGQQHWVTTREVHFTKQPPSGLMEGNTMELRRRSVEEPITLASYRSQELSLNMTLTVLSCEPRVFEIKNFLSQPEVNHIMEIAHYMNLSESTLGDLDTDSKQVRTSSNTWVTRRQSAVIDAIYRRSADLLRIDEALMRTRPEGEKLENFPYYRPFVNKSIAEDLQLVHYSKDQEYQTHHDFAFAPLSAVTDPARFATLLLYLNDDMEGGETSFPKFLNAHTFEGLKVKPEVGKAVLFYSQLPDGNMDELSQHKAHIVRDKEKWLINLWVWDPIKTQ